MLLNDPEWAKWSDREIARRVAVSHNFASEMRKSLSSDDSEPRTYTDRHGNVTTMNTANIGGGLRTLASVFSRLSRPIAPARRQCRSPTPGGASVRLE